MTEWRLRGLKAKVKGKVGEMLRGPGGVSGCCGKAGQLAELRLEPGCEEWMLMVVDGRAGRSVGCEVCVSLYSCYRGSKRARRGGGGWSFSCRSRSKLQQTSGKALPLGREGERAIRLMVHIQRKLSGLFLFHSSFMGRSDRLHFF